MKMMRNLLLSAATLMMLGFICCDHHKSHINIEGVIDSVANEALSDTTGVDTMAVDSMVGDSLQVDSVVVK